MQGLGLGAPKPPREPRESHALWNHSVAQPRRASTGAARTHCVFLEEDRHSPACRLNLHSIRLCPETVTGSHGLPWQPGFWENGPWPSRDSGHTVVRGPEPVGSASSHLQNTLCVKCNGS